MKTIGLLGGMSWESTQTYYRLINQAIREKLGGLHSARLVLYSVDFHDIEVLQRRGDWQAAGVLLAQAAHRRVAHQGGPVGVQGGLRVGHLGEDGHGIVVRRDHRIHLGFQRGGVARQIHFGGAAGG